MIIDYVLQPGIQILFIIGLISLCVILLSDIKIKKNYKIIIYILSSLGIYHYFVLPIIFVHEFGAYEGYDYRNLLKDENGEPKYQNIIFRKDKQTTLEAVSMLVQYIKKENNIETNKIIEDVFESKNKERILVLSEKIDEN